ncbi:Acriflavine sensitivity control protein acr-2 [Fusarium oxysporum f. sp. rapae]|uniref:Acriflavine sensitivity control protein acr-2 n=1 Tax=Fusarium oxysporum f. sp. rapae TaxID=485398 RepID=A0A8J5TZ41_FUSOX|nr:Acriflavine sensitivity control protein acr-2 [Fusarium oxysporum f. sp. rapae]
MPKRPYRPKVKGCYECSQRRLNCDRGVPECQKCIKKGVKCSGLGIRHRFSDGVASRGHCIGKTMDTAYLYMKNAKSYAPRSKDEPGQPFNSDSTEQNLANTPTESSALSPLQFLHELIDMNTIQFDDAHVPDPSDRTPGVYDDPPILWDLSYGDDGFSFLNIENQQNQSLKFGEALPSSDVEPFIFNNALILPSSHPDHIPAWKRCLLLHCGFPARTAITSSCSTSDTSIVSENIAGEMIAIDGPHNGWRHLVLPIADHDELVMDAVLAVSLFHKPEILQDISLAVRPEEEYYARAIHGLQERSQLRDYNQLTRHSIILTILLLLTAVMVNGSSDFPILFGMLQSAIDAIGGDMELGSGGTAEFLSRQIRKIKVYAAPLLSEQTGIDIISSETEVNKIITTLSNWYQF